MKRTLLSQTFLSLIAISSMLSLRAQSISFVTTDATCYALDGTVDATVTGGQPPYEFDWSNGATTEDLVNVPSGNYTLTVTDDNNQQWSDVAIVDQNILVIDIEYAYSFAYDGSAHHPCPGTCNGQIGILSDLFIGGTPPYQNVDVYDSNLNLKPFLGIDNGTTYAYGGLCPGETLEVYVVDAIGCGGYTQISAGGATQIPMPLFDITGASSGMANGEVNIDIGVGAGGWGLTHEVINDQNNVVFLDWSITSGAYDVTGLYAGNYTLRITYDAMQQPCYEEFPFVIPDLNVAGILEGTVYKDNDQDCVQDPAEPGIPNVVLEITPGPEYAITNSYGFYQLTLPHGNYDLTQTHAALDQICPANTPVNFDLTAGMPLAQIDLADTALNELDIELFHSRNTARPGFVFRQTLLVANASPDSTGQITLTYTPDPILQLDSSNMAYSTNANEINWTLPSLAPYGQTTVHVFFTVPAATPIGTTLFNTANVVGTVPELDLANNSMSEQVIVFGSYDPNDKLSYPEGSFVLGQDSVIDYTIRFQNTGTDTAFNVVITDTLSVDLDLTTLEIGAASHLFDYSLEAGGVLKFTFENILLPDSNVNEAASHGYVGFRIRPVDGLMVGSMISNTANIFFDFNTPVITDPNILMIDASTSIAENAASGLFVYPNPTNGSVRITAEETSITDLELLDVSGRVLLRKFLNGLVELDMSGFTAGLYFVKTNCSDGTTRISSISVQ